jgi:hypothetical protein
MGMSRTRPYEGNVTLLVRFAISQGTNHLI